jgi:hypothetical protein
MRIIYAVLLSSLSSVLVHIPLLSAQTRFEWPAVTNWDISRYKTIDMCLAAITYKRDSVIQKTPVYRDTMPVSQGEFNEPLPEIIVENARRCSTKFQADQIPVREIVNAFQLFLIANRDADAQALVSRRLSLVPDTAIVERTAVLDTFATLYLQAMPARLEAADPLLMEYVELGSVLPARQRFNRLGSVFVFMQRAGESVRAKRAAEWIVSIPTTLGKEEDRSVMSDLFVRMILLNASYHLIRDELIDSLKQGIPGYVALQHASWTKLTKEVGTAIPVSVGERAPDLQGDFWFPKDAPAASNFLQKISLVLFVDKVSKSEGDYWSTFASLRRLTKQFPNLSVTVVMRTVGYFGPLVTSPKEEAELLRHWLQELHKVPGTLSVTTTKYWRLPDPDRRIIEQEIPNIVNYSFGKSKIAEWGNAWIINQQGIITYWGALNRYTENEFATYINILQQSQSQSQRAAH